MLTENLNKEKVNEIVGEIKKKIEKLAGISDMPPLKALNALNGCLEGIFREENIDEIVGEIKKKIEKLAEILDIPPLKALNNLNGCLEGIFREEEDHSDLQGAGGKAAE